MSTTAEKAPTSDIAARVTELRELASTDVEAAASAAWAWIEELGAEAKADREGGEAKLDELFALGKAPKGLDRPNRGHPRGAPDPVGRRQGRQPDHLGLDAVAGQELQCRRADRREPPPRRDPLDRQAALAALRHQGRPRRPPGLRLRDPRRARGARSRHRGARDRLRPDRREPEPDHQVDPRRAGRGRARRQPGQDPLPPGGGGYRNIGFFALRS